MKKSIFSALCLVLLATTTQNAWGETATVDLCTSWNTAFAYTSEYTHDYTIDNLSGGTTTLSFAVLGVYRAGNANTYFQMNKKTGYFKNTTAFP